MSRRKSHLKGMTTSIHNGREPVYQKLANLLEGLIHDRALRPGDRVPSVRRFSSQQRVSVPTALQAYATLETRGLIEARPKSGYFVRARQANLAPEPKSPTAAPKVTTFAGSDAVQSLLADHADTRLTPLGA